MCVVISEMGFRRELADARMHPCDLFLGIGNNVHGGMHLIDASELPRGGFVYDEAAPHNHDYKERIVRIRINANNLLNRRLRQLYLQHLLEPYRDEQIADFPAERPVELRNWINSELQDLSAGAPCILISHTANNYLYGGIRAPEVELLRLHELERSQASVVILPARPVVDDIPFEVEFARPMGHLHASATIAVMFDEREGVDVRLAHLIEP